MFWGIDFAVCPVGCRCRGKERAREGHNGTQLALNDGGVDGVGTGDAARATRMGMV